MKRPALQNKQIVLLRIAFRTRKVLGTFEKQGPEPINWVLLISQEESSNVLLVQSLDSEDGFRTDFRNISPKQQSLSGLQSPIIQGKLIVLLQKAQIMFHNGYNKDTRGSFTKLNTRSNAYHKNCQINQTTRYHSKTNTRHFSIKLNKSLDSAIRPMYYKIAL